MTAFDTYWSALMEQNLPASVPTVQGNTEGMRTATFDVLENGAARGGVESNAWRDRATVAIFACRATHEADAATVVNTGP